MDLFFALATGNIPRVEKLINDDPDLIHTTDLKNRTPIFYPVIYRRKTALNCILSLSKPNLQHIDQYGYTVYDYAHYIDSRFGSNYLSLLENVCKSSNLKKDIQNSDLDFDTD